MSVQPDFDYERVEEDFACPDCSEDAMDCLIYDDQDLVTCQTCGAIYDPATGKTKRGGEVD